MNLREYNNYRLKKEYRKALLKLILFLLIFIPILILSVYFLLFFLDVLDSGSNTYYFGSFLFILGSVVILRIVVETNFFYRLVEHKKYFLSHSVCSHCLNTVYLFTENNEEWQCNYCGKSFSGNILEQCPSCKAYQRLFECPFCEKLIDINAEYDTDKLWEMQNERQTDLIQQKNQDKQIADGSE